MVPAARRTTAAAATRVGVVARTVVEAGRVLVLVWVEEPVVVAPAVAGVDFVRAAAASSGVGPDAGEGGLSRRRRVG